MLEIQEFRLEERQSQVAIIGLFLHKASKQHVLVATTHLKAKPGFEERRAKQGASLLAKIHSVVTAASLPKSPFIVVGGDFNDTPDSFVASLFRGSVTTPTESLSNPLGSLQSAYSAHPAAKMYGSDKDAAYP
jgi:endonuclease/exonuclease/phosphatase family metal-dependent hydrolase